MLPAAHRMRRPAEFERAVRRGARCGRQSLVVHVAEQMNPGPVLVGFVVSKAVGNAVVRNSVKRRLRGVVGERIGQLPTGELVVVRALPVAADLSSRVLAADFDAALIGARRRQLAGRR
ncbi:ribonuclease P protein component [Pengzhenrongella sicca]|uniref:Ribonuclease P protein component n=1 Tax=Pengzhenrongella sicca TaxID=2819238 RepID=A0A8A4ZCA7_9MICO|nr:ribonuclease P protein component [Pengzhenrongella sicca]QTE29504.1 ribonuclease P protein component [Pengzhenrongella sicca]